MGEATVIDLLTAAISRNYGSAARLANATRITAGASCESWRFDLHRDGGSTSETMVLRRPPADTGLFERIAAGRQHEAKILRTLSQAGLPVPEVQFELAPEDGLGSGYVMEFLEGEPLPHRILKDGNYDKARAALPAQLANFRHRLNAVSPDPFADLPDHTAVAQIVLFEDLMDQMETRHDGVELGLSWLRDHQPEPVACRLVHGDYRLSNFLITPRGLNAVIDWELAHRGDPAEDLAWLCVRSWRFSRPDLPAAGLTDRPSLLQAWKEASGETITPDQLLFWEVLGNVKWAILCLLQGHRFITGADRSIELAVIGRRVEEPIHDLIRLLEGRDGNFS
jgi:aminoglycoside phosphotransferase (APT) family kinase protein